MKYKLILACLTISAIVFLVDFTTTASPYGQGVYNADVPYGGETSLSITAGSGVNLSLNPSTSGTLASGSGTVTVYSTDVVGYKLYVRALTSTSMTQGAFTIPASANVTAAPLAINTWGFNTDASSNFVGISLSDTLLKDAAGPFGAGDPTQVTYGLYVDRSKPAGSYASNVMYTAVPETP
jgi:hypothetical protein